MSVPAKPTGELARALVRTVPDFVRAGAGLRGEVDGERAEQRRLAWVACVIWPSFFALDVLMIVLLFPDAPSMHFLAMRLAAELLFLLAYWTARSPRRSVVRARRTFLLAVQVAAIFIAMMALEFGGLTSAYMHGISIVMIVLAVYMPARARTTLRTFAPLVATYPLVMSIAVAASPDTRAAWLDRHTLLTFASHFIFVIAVMIIGSLASHNLWTARRQVYQARRLGRYRLEAPIGEGGMNQIWLAWDAPLQRYVALKLLRAKGSPDDRAVQRFEREARAASGLMDPHTIRTFDFGASDDGIYYLAMEYLRGADLAALVASHGAMPPARAVRFAVQACASLAEAHDAGVIHRDVKPQNLFVTRVGDDYDFLKLLDFGIARTLDRETDNLTETGVVSGTPAFMAPEVCRGERADARSDLYSLGATLYFLLAGSPPFVGPNHGHLLSAHLLQTPEPPSVHRGEPLPAPLEAVVLRCLAKDPNARFQSARELAAALTGLTGIDTWTAEDARRFWEVERVAKFGRWQASTLDSLGAVRPGSASSASPR